MKYYTTIIGLFSFSILTVLLNLYFGNLSNKSEKEINKLKITMIELEDQIKINEIEYAYHTNLKYLTKLDRIYNIQKNKTKTETSSKTQKIRRNPKTLKNIKGITTT